MSRQEQLWRFVARKGIKLGVVLGSRKQKFLSGGGLIVSPPCRVNSLRDSMCDYLLQRKATPKQHDYFATWQAIHKAGPSFGQEEGHEP